MKTSILTIAALAAVSSLAAGCAVRDAKMWTDDTGKVLATRNNEIKACYDGVLKGTPTAAGKVTVKFEVETDEGKITKVAVDKANTTAPDAVQDCVTKNLNGLAVSPPDKKTGDGTWVYEFNAGAPAPMMAPKS